MVEKNPSRRICETNTGLGIFKDDKIVEAGCIEKWIAFLHPAAPGLILGIPKNFSLDIVEIY